MIGKEGNEVQVIFVWYVKLVLLSCLTLMRILLVDTGSFVFQDLKQEFAKTGHQIDSMYYHFKDKYSDSFFEERFDMQINTGKYDTVISINFFPLIAIICQSKNVPYVSWSYDSPLEEQLSNFFDFDTNFIFLFDREEVDYYHSQGYMNVFHLPLAINTSRLEKLTNRVDSKYCADISFVGKIYESNLNTLLLPVNEYVKGYIEGLFQSQLRIYGFNFLENMLQNDIIDSINEAYSNLGQNKARLTKRGLAYAIYTQITYFERSFLLNELSELYDVHIYTTSTCELSSSVHKHGPVKYFSEMNYVFTNSKINLCPTLRSIASGIPLRALDVMGVGGCLFSNYQPELAEWFVDGEEVIMYDSIENAFDKMEYYLNNEQKLCSIANKGNEKVKKYFDYSQRIEKLLGVVK